MEPFVFTGKPTILLYAEAPQKAEAANVVKIDFAPGKALVPLFMFTEAAEQFLLSLGQAGKGMNIFHLEGFDALDTLLADLQKEGVTHVDFNAKRDRANPIPIGEVLDSLRNRPKG
jgi:hypothetical protein